MRRLRVPFSAAARSRVRRRLFAGGVLAYGLFAFFLYRFVRGAMGPTSIATPAAAYVSLSAAASWGILVYVLIGPYRSGPGWHLTFGVLVGSGLGVLALGDDQGSWHLAAPLAAAVTIGAALASGAFGVLYARNRSQRALGWTGRRPADRRAAMKMHEASLSVGKKARKGAAEEGRAADLNAARAAIARSYGDDSPDGLVEASDRLRRLLESCAPDEWVELLSAAVDLLEAASVKAEKQGDLSDYPAALQLLTDVADRVPPDAGAMAFVCSGRAEYHAMLWDRLPPGAEAEQHAAQALTAAQEAIAIAAVTPAIRNMMPGLHRDLGFLLAQVRTGPGDLAAGIAECRTAVRLARSPRARAAAWRSLAMLLMDHAAELAGELSEQTPRAVVASTVSAVDAALAEAERVVRWARWCGGFDARASAWALLAELRTARALFFGDSDRHRRAARTWRHASRAAGADPMSQVQIGRGWADWAESTGVVGWCAEAYAYLMSGIPRAVAVRYLAGERDRILAGLQSTAEEAGYWLAQAGRLEDAVKALEFGRAVSLSEVLGRERPDLDALLASAGRLDLLERYRQTLEAYNAATASLLHNHDLTSAAQRAWTDYDTVLREIAAVTGLDLTGEQLTPAELATATAEGPVVYLAAAAHGGYAIIASAEAPPRFLSLPLLNRAEAADLAESFLRVPEPDQAKSARMGEIAAVSRRLWLAGIGTLARELPAGALVTVIPVGQLSLLPVHAAGGPTAFRQAAEDWEFLADRITVRYAPNVRTLLTTRQRADALSRVPLTLLAVAAPDGDTGNQVPQTVREVTEIARQWTQAKLITDGSFAALGDLSGEDTVWHLACHCDTVPDRILDSALLLSQDRVTLRTILAAPSVPRRLAVLSACSTHVSGTDLPDEAMGLPAGLLQAGFAGVVASHWVADDRSTAFVMIRFHELWHGQGLSPATALAEAQRSLRLATYADLHASRDRVAALPADRSAERLAQPEGARSNAHLQYAHPYFWAPFALTGH